MGNAESADGSLSQDSGGMTPEQIAQMQMQMQMPAGAQPRSGMTRQQQEASFRHHQQQQRMMQQQQQQQQTMNGTAQPFHPTRTTTAGPQHFQKPNSAFPHPNHIYAPPQQTPYPNDPRYVSMQQSPHNYPQHTSQSSRQAAPPHPSHFQHPPQPGYHLPQNYVHQPPFQNPNQPQPQNQIAPDARPYNYPTTNPNPIMPPGGINNWQQGNTLPKKGTLDPRQAAAAYAKHHQRMQHPAGTPTPPGSNSSQYSTPNSSRHSSTQSLNQNQPKHALIASSKQMSTRTPSVAVNVMYAKNEQDDPYGHYDLAGGAVGPTTAGAKSPTMDHMQRSLYGGGGGTTSARFAPPTAAIADMHIVGSGSAGVHYTSYSHHNQQPSSYQEIYPTTSNPSHSMKHYQAAAMAKAKHALTAKSAQYAQGQAVASPSAHHSRSSSTSTEDEASQWKHAWEEDDDSSQDGGVGPPERPISFRPGVDSGHSSLTPTAGLSHFQLGTVEDQIIDLPKDQLTIEEDMLSKRATQIIDANDGVQWDTLSESITTTTGVTLYDRPCVQMFYPLLRVLGKGSFGKVVLVRKRTGAESGGLFAMKILRKAHLVKRRQIERTKTERKVLAVADHTFIMKLHFAFQTEDKLYLVLDYCPGGELFFHLSRYRRFPERVARFYTAELVLAIDHLHSKGIIYRDLKPENVLLDAEGHVKLGDFGLAKDKINHPCKGATSMCGTPEYMSPEVLSQAGHGFCVDYWGLGMLVYEMMTGLPPWYTTDRSKLFKKLKSAPLEVPSYFSPASTDCVKHLLQRNQYKRLGVNGVDEVKSHPFFQQPPLDFDMLVQRRIEAPIRPCEGWKATISEKATNPSSLSNGFSGNHEDADNTSVAGMTSKELDVATANFDKSFTRMPVETVDVTGDPTHQGEENEDDETASSQLNTDTFIGFTFDENNPAPANASDYPYQPPSDFPSSSSHPYAQQPARR